MCAKQLLFFSCFSSTICIYLSVLFGTPGFSKLKHIVSCASDSEKHLHDDILLRSFPECGLAQ